MVGVTRHPLRTIPCLSPPSRAPRPVCVGKNRREGIDRGGAVLAWIVVVVAAPCPMRCDQTQAPGPLDV